MKELGFDVEYYLWVGMFAPKGTPDAVIALSARRHSTRPRTPTSIKTALTNLGQELDYLDQPEFAKFWEADAKRIEAAVRQIGKVEG